MRVCTHFVHARFRTQIPRLVHYQLSYTNITHFTYIFWKIYFFLFNFTCSNIHFKKYRYAKFSIETEFHVGSSWIFGNIGSPEFQRNGYEFGVGSWKLVQNIKISKFLRVRS